KVMGSCTSENFPVSKSTRRALMRSSNICLTCALERLASPNPAIARILRCLSSKRFSICVGRKATAAPATNTEHTKHTNKATVSVRAVDSLGLDIACQPPLDIGLNNKVVNQWCAQVSKQNSQHHAFWERWVNHADQHHHHTNQCTKNPLTGISHGRRHRIRGHKDHA